jgi:lipid-A-disaccharide synthase
MKRTEEANNTRLLATKPVFAIVVGEHSGDTLGEGLIKALKQRYPDAEFIGIGGPKMQALGFHSLFPMEELAVMGIVEVLKHLPRLLHIRRSLVRYFTQHPPSVFIGIDAPDFNLGLELKLKQSGIKTVHYVSPSVWAWREKRVFKIKAATDMVLALLPFEKSFYDKYQVPCTFVGHTLADDIPLITDQHQARQTLSLPENKLILALMPGSRAGELAQLATPFLQSAQALLTRYPELEIVVAMINEARAQQFNEIKQTVAPDLPCRIFINQTRQVMAASDCLLMASGTVTLEGALYKKPMVIAYKFNWLTYQLGQWLVKLPWFSLPNLLLNEGVVPELLQDEVSPEIIVPLLEQRLFCDQSQLKQKFMALHQQLKCQANERAATAIIELITHE